MDSNSFYFWLSQHPQLDIQPVVAFNPHRDKLLALDFTEENNALTTALIEDTSKFSQYITETLQAANSLYGIGGYNEHRTVYARSRVFDGAVEEDARCIHLGVDIWGDAGTEVAAPLDAIVHSFAFNEAYGDYGATIILMHQIAGAQFYSLYGHLALKDLAHLTEGKFIHAGEVFAHFGEPAENGHWPPHLHFQLILDMENKKGDYPGVCSLSDREKYLRNCPNPDTLLNLIQWAK
ncbi:MAG: peptidase M23 [Sphingobacteriia bacterium 28-36-52]|nr:MAG: peptidase M23 [Sphingobacteriia bacterium 32-37-4]OYZ00691.1 MAG: peptidase M23 [Sphingobacteriia bacterium 28-36-52]